MNAEDELQLKSELERLKQEHRDLDSAIDALTLVPGSDRLQVQRLKKRKLQLRDQIQRIEDQLFPKRAHYHTYVAHNISRREYRDKIRLACEQRDALDKDFVIIARSDAARIQGYREAITRVNLAAELGADMSLVFPRDHKEAVNAPKDSELPIVYVQSRGTRDGRPLYNYRQLAEMGYAAVIDATLAICVNFHFTQKMLAELKRTGDYSGMTEQDFVAARKGVEDLIGLEDYYRIERATVEKAGRAKTKR